MSDFRPYIAPDEAPPELTARALILGAVLGVVCGAASAYLALRVGLTVAASVPIAVLANWDIRSRRGQRTTTRTPAAPVFRLRCELVPTFASEPPHESTPTAVFAVLSCSLLAARLLRASARRGPDRAACAPRSSDRACRTGLTDAIAIPMTP